MTHPWGEGSPPSGRRRSPDDGSRSPQAGEERNRVLSSRFTGDVKGPSQATGDGAAKTPVSASRPFDSMDGMFNGMTHRLSGAIPRGKGREDGLNICGRRPRNPDHPSEQGPRVTAGRE
jgi:hypothetical protein